MGNILIIGHAYTNNPEAHKHLSDPAKQLGAPLLMIGANQPWPEDHANYQKIISILRSRPEEYCIVTDSYDVLMVRWNEQEAISALDCASGRLISCEDNCWPPGKWCESYTRTPDCYAINAGQFGGRKGSIIDFMETVYSGRWSVESGGMNQEIMHKMYADGVPMELDTHCRIFQSMSGSSSNRVIMKDRKLINRETGAFPMFLHFNGRTPGIEEWYGKVYGTAD